MSFKKKLSKIIADILQETKFNICPTFPGNVSKEGKEEERKKGRQKERREEGKVEERKEYKPKGDERKPLLLCG